jgi:hypothetical protein
MKSDLTRIPMSPSYSPPVKIIPKFGYHECTGPSQSVVPTAWKAAPRFQVNELIGVVRVNHKPLSFFLLANRPVNDGAGQFRISS